MTDSQNTGTGRSRRACLLVVLAITGGCGARRGSVAAWRLVPTSGSTSVLVPPGVRNASVDYQKLTLAPSALSKACAQSDGGLTLHPGRRRLTVGIHSSGFADRPPGWLNALTSRLAEQGCFDTTESPAIATAIAESLPLEENLAFTLLYSGDNSSGSVDVGPGVRLEVTRPLLPDGASPAASPPVVSGDNSLEVTISAPDMLGYEVSLYMLKTLEGHEGIRIVPLSGERHVGNTVQRVPESALTLFDFAPGVAYYRLLRKSDRTEFSAFVLAGKTVAQIEELSRRIEASLASCQEAPRYCAAIPRAVAINALEPILVNGHEQLVRWGSNVGDVIRQNAEPRPDKVLSTLLIYKPHSGRLALVNFDRTKRSILDLVLGGGETLQWRKP